MHLYIYVYIVRINPGRRRAIGSILSCNIYFIARLIGHVRGRQYYFNKPAIDYYTYMYQARSPIELYICNSVIIINIYICKITMQIKKITLHAGHAKVRGHMHAKSP